MQWDSSNAQALLDYCASQRYNISWELGNGKCLLARPAVTQKGTTRGYGLVALDVLDNGT